MPQYNLPPWVGTPADPAAHYASGMQIGIRLGAEQAANIYRQQQMQREAQHEALQAQQYQQQLQRELQKDAFDVAYKDQARQLEIDQITRKHRAVANYQSMIAAGADPMQALMSVGPDMGVSPLEVEKINAVNQFKATEEARRRESAASLQSHRKFLEGAKTREMDLMAKRENRLAKGTPKLDPVAARQLSSAIIEMRGVRNQLEKWKTENPDYDPLDPPKEFKQIINRQSRLQRQIDELSKPAAASSEQSAPDSEAMPAAQAVPESTQDAAAPAPDTQAAPAVQRFRFVPGQGFIDLSQPAPDEETTPADYEESAQVVD